ncbi:MAG: HigA family addiction module antitoxin [Acidobacteriaceae bacterium]|nr:HigA family addiction module antitoxin [Acidobacteriaceae bacterium]
MQMYNPAHPGAILREAMGEDITITHLARHLRMTRANLSMILNGRMSVSPLVATKLAEAFPWTDAELWLRLQNQYDLAKVLRKKRQKILPVRPHKPVEHKLKNAA